jgi:hypothetical protein
MVLIYGIDKDNIWTKELKTSVGINKEYKKLLKKEM